MVQGNRDIEQDVKDILSTREELTEKIELLRRRMRGTAWHTKYQVLNSLDKVKNTVGSVRRLFHPSYQVLRHKPVLITGMIMLVSFLRRRRGDYTQRGDHGLKSANSDPRIH